VGFEPTTSALSFQEFPYSILEAFFKSKEGKGGKKGDTYHYTKATSERLNTSSCIVFGESKKESFFVTG
jgi:hypothetical protein